MSEIQISSRYAKSLIELASEKGLLEEVYQDMVLLDKTCDENRPLRLLLANPLVHNYKQLEVLRKVFSGKITAMTTAFLELIVKKTREAIVPAIAKAFIAQYRLLHNLEDAEVITAEPLNSEMREKILAAATQISGGKKITLKEIVKPEIIGGFILQVRDNQIDSSVKSRLDSLRLHFVR
jgi:F-type H+-transporting ATPase subunit delta